MNDSEFATSLAPQRTGLRILELGIEYGISTMHWAALAKKLSGQVIAVDHWQETPLIRKQFMTRYQSSPYQDCLAIYEKDLFEVVNSLPPAFFDVIFFDAIYCYPEVKEMIERYLPKLKKDGLCIGHGADFYWSKMPNSIKTIWEEIMLVDRRPEIPTEATEDFTNNLFLADVWRTYFISHPEQRKGYFLAAHAALSRALFEIFGDDYQFNAKHTTWWRLSE